MITIVGAAEPFDIRRCPVWAIPQLAFILRRFNSDWPERENASKRAEMVSFRFAQGNSGPDCAGIGEIAVTDEGIYTFTIYKSGMRKPSMPALNYLP